MRFFVPADGPVDGEGPAELAAHQDFVWLSGDNNYRTIAAATLAVFRHVVATYDFSFVLKVCTTAAVQGQTAKAK